jgi:hypothetical protein
MNMYPCPNCSKPAVTFWQKQRLGLGRTVECANCHTRIRVPWGYGFVYVVLGSIVPIFGGLVAMSLTGAHGPPLGLITAIFIVGMLLAEVPFVWLHHRYAPLRAA